MRVRCRTHNALHAEQVFGRAHVEARIRLRRRKCASAQPSFAPSFERAAEALGSMGFRGPEVRRALATLETKLGADTAPVETLVREGLRLLT